MSKNSDFFVCVIGSRKGQADLKLTMYPGMTRLFQSVGVPGMHHTSGVGDQIQSSINAR